MDITMIYALIIVLGIIGLTFIINKLRKNNIISSEDLSIVQKLFSLSISIVDELDLKNEDKILQISNIVLCAIDYSNNIFLEPEQVAENALKKCYELCEELNIELTENRKLILAQLINVGLSNKYKQEKNYLKIK